MFLLSFDPFKIRIPQLKFGAMVQLHYHSTGLYPWWHSIHFLNRIIVYGKAREHPNTLVKLFVYPDETKSIWAQQVLTAL